MSKDKKYTFHVARAKGAARSYTKKEKDLNEREINLLLGNLVKTFQDAPDIVKELFAERLFTYLMKDLNGTDTITSSDNGNDSDTSINDIVNVESSGINTNNNNDISTDNRDTGV